MTTRVKAAGWDDEFGWCTAVWTFFVHVRKREIVGHTFLSAPVPNAMDAKGVTTTNEQAKCDRFLHTDRTDQGLARISGRVRVSGGNVSEPAFFSPLAISSCEIPAGLALVVRSQFLVLTVLEFAFVARETAPGGVVVPANPPRF